MFYSQFILAKKGPLGTIWIAAHLERKLRKNQVADTDIGVSVDSILSPDVPIALRLSSHLLLGVVRIYSRKVNYLFHDCSEALLKVKQAFRSTAVDLPPEESTAPYHSITLPETFDLDDFELPDSDNFHGNFVDHHVSTREQITLQDSLDGVVYSTSQFGLDERFGDGDTSHIGFDLDEELYLDNVTASGRTSAPLDLKNLDLEASAQPMTPMTPYMGMDMDDDDVMTGEERTAEVTATEAKEVKIDSDAQNEYVVKDTSPLRGIQNQSLDSDGHVFPCEQTGNAYTDTPDGSAQCAPYIPRLAEEISANVHFNEAQVHDLVNEASLSNFEEVIMQDFPNNMHHESEHCEPKSMDQEIFENNPSEHNFHNKETIEVGDCSLPDNKSSEADVSHVLEDAHAKQNAVDMTSTSFDVGLVVSSPTSVLAEQMKPTSPSVGLIDRGPAVPEIMERAGSSQNGEIIHENPSCSDARTSVPAEHMEPSSSSVGLIDRGLVLPEMMEKDGNTHASNIQAEVFPFVDIASNTAPASVLMGTCYQPIPSSEGVSANSVLTNDHQTKIDRMSESRRVSHTDILGVHNSRDLPDLETPYGAESLLLAEGAHVFNKEETRTWFGPEVTNIQHSGRPDQESSEPRHVLRPCTSHFKHPETVIPVHRDLTLNLFDSSLGGAQPCSSLILGQEEPAHIFGASSLVQGEDRRPPSMRDAALDANKISGPIPSNSMEAGPSYLHEGMATVRPNNQLGNSSLSGGWNFAVPEYERMLSAPAAIPFGVNDFLGQSNFEKERFAEHQLNEFNTLSGRKRHQMESTPVGQYGSSAALSGMMPKRATDSIPDDYDILSSILVGKKSSAIKLRPTPQQSETSKKRQRVTPRTNAAKRKVLLDDTMVLHGDTIRLQLTSTEDIRRVRKKAPCTRPEIWIIQKHLLEDEIFVEPLFTGISLDLLGVYNRRYGVATESRVSEMHVANLLPEVRDEVFLPKSMGAVVTESRISEMDVAKVIPEARAEVFHPKTSDHSGEANREVTGEPVLIVHEGEINEPRESVIQSDKVECEDHNKPIEGDIEEQTRPVTDIVPSDLDKDQSNVAVAMEIEDGSGVAERTHDAEINVNEHSVVSSIVSEDKCSETVGTANELLPVDASNGIDTILQNDGRLDIQSSENGFIIERGDDVIHVVNASQGGLPLVDGVLMESAQSVQEISENGSVKVVEQIVTEDHQVDLSNGCSPTDVMLDNSLTQNKADMHSDACIPLENDKPLFPDSSVANELPTDPTLASKDCTIEGVSEEAEHLIVNDSVKEDTENPASSPKDSPRPLEFDVNTEIVPSVEDENLGSQEVAQEKSEDGTNPNSPGDDGETVLYGNDTEFLNDDYDDDNEAIEEDDDSNVPDTEEAAVPDNSGWSSRTRGVAKYLQTLFDTESGYGRKNLSMDNLLSGKTRKEACRMFFETLVLKTRDYVHVEQENPFESINIKPRGKLMKSEF